VDNERETPYDVTLALGHQDLSLALDDGAGFVGEG